MIDDHQIGIRGTLPHTRNKSTDRNRGTSGPGIYLGARVYVSPEREIFGKAYELGAVATVLESRAQRRARSK
ncbi:MAG: hypothetical protein WKF84_13815 [Pyrinomonadaceae bacterium]